MLKHNKKNFFIILAISAILIIVSCASLVLGTVKIPLHRFFEIIAGKGNLIENNIFFGMRLPRLLMALAVGSSLSLAGVLLQAIFRNPLVEPYTTGISGGASFAVCLLVSTGLVRTLGSFSLYLAGFLGACSVIAFLYSLHFFGRIKNITTLLLAGIMMSFVFSSLIMLTLAFSKAEDAHGIIFWLMGALDTTRLNLAISALVLSFICLLFTLYYFHELDALLLGEEAALHLGINVRKSQIRFFLVASVLTAISVSISGIIGFVGLAIPIIMRKIIASKHNFLLLGSYFAGSAFLALCDLIARTIISPRELPVGVITGIIGGSIFIYTLLNSKK